MEIADQARRYPTAGRRKAVQSSANSGLATGANLLIFSTGQSMEAVMSGHGDDAGQCSNGLSAQKFRAATPEERTIYRKWIFGMVAFYTTLLLLSGMVAIAIESSISSTKLTAASAQRAAMSHRTN
jgi:hypothetical protein